MTTYGLLIFDGAEELDFTGPWEVFTTSGMVRDDADTRRADRRAVRAVRCAKGMRVLPDHTLDSHPPLDVLLVPGGQGTRREVGNPAVIDWIRAVSPRPRGRPASAPGRCCCTRPARPAAGGWRPTSRSRTRWPSPRRHHRGARRPLRRRREPRDEPGRLGRDRHGAVARRPPARPRARPRGTPVHPVRASAAVPGRRASLA